MIKRYGIKRFWQSIFVGCQAIVILSACNHQTDVSLETNNAANIESAAVDGMKAVANTNIGTNQTEAFKNSTDEPPAQNLQDATESLTTTADIQEQEPIEPQIDENSVEFRMAKAIPAIEYSIDDLSPVALQVNRASWYGQEKLDRDVIIRIQALLNWHQHGVGAVNGQFNKNVIKAMQAFQKNKGLRPSNEMNAETWLALTENDELTSRPVLVNYTLTKEDVRIPYHPKGQQYHSVKEALAEKFHMSQALLKELNAKKSFKAGEVITVYNPSVPNTLPVNKVVVDKTQNILYAFNDKDELVATYPTTVGSRYTPSPNGHYTVTSRVLNPTYNKDFKNKNSVLPPGPNNPVGKVWLGLNKRGFGIHGSPDPEKISQQHSHGCVRLTNWDALALYSTINEGATVEFL